MHDFTRQGLNLDLYLYTSFFLLMGHALLIVGFTSLLEIFFFLQVRKVGTFEECSCNSLLSVVFAEYPMKNTQQTRLC